MLERLHAIRAALAARPLLVKAVGYPLFFLFWFVLFVYVTFPYDRLKETIVAQAEAPRRGANGAVVPSNLELTIGELGPTFLPGLHARNVAVTFLPTKVGERATTMRLDHVKVHVGLFALAFNRLNADFDLEGLGGEVEGHVEQTLSGTRAGLREFELEADDIRLGDVAPVAALVGLPVSGKLDAKVEFHVPDGRVDQSTGNAHVTVEDLRLGDGRAQYQIPHFGGITVEQIRAGTLEGTVTIRDGVATIERLAARSNEFNFAMDGQVRLANVLPESQLGANVRFQLTDAYRNKSEQAGRIMMVMDTVPDLSAARRPDGMIGFRCSGNFARGLVCPPDRRGGGGGSGSARGGFGFPAPRRGFEGE